MELRRNNVAIIQHDGEKFVTIWKDKKKLIEVKTTKCNLKASEMELILDAYEKLWRD